jgi:hypothetical protein
VTEPPPPGGVPPSVDPSGGTCPNCGTPYAPMQEYCLECGRRLPLTRGIIPALAGAWQSHVPWYPGDWIWPVALLALIAALAGTASYFASKSSGHKKTVVATTGTTGTSTEGSTARTGTGAFPSTTGQTSPPPPPPPPPSPPPPPPPPAQTHPISWPANKNGFTAVLLSVPVNEGRTAAEQVADRAIDRGLPKVGILDSGRFSSLHPGYYVVFSGVYNTQPSAHNGAAQAQGKGFPGAYSRRIAH